MALIHSFKCIATGFALLNKKKIDFNTKHLLTTRFSDWNYEVFFEKKGNIRKM